MKASALRVTLGADVELTYSSKGTAIASLFVAENRYTKNNDGGFDTKTSWYNVKAFGRTAEKLAEDVSKGDSISFEGSYVTEQYEKNGEKKTSHTILIDRFVKLARKDSNE
jgi:single-strand DNA-binding protein